MPPDDGPYITVPTSCVDRIAATFVAHQAGIDVERNAFDSGASSRICTQRFILRNRSGPNPFMLCARAMIGAERHQFLQRRRPRLKVAVDASAPAADEIHFRHRAFDRRPLKVQRGICARLCADDNRDARMTLASALSAMGDQLVLTGQRQQATEYLRRAQQLLTTLAGVSARSYCLNGMTATTVWFPCISPTAISG